MAAPARATVSADGRTVTLSRNRWDETFPASDLPGRQAFYRHLAERKAGKYAAFYTPVIRALDRAAKILTAYGAAA